MNEPDRLELMLKSQRELQIEAFGLDPAELHDEEARVEFIRWNVLALMDELSEVLQEVGWKPWATSRHVNEDACLKELVDAWHFFMNLLWVTYGQGVLGDANVLAESFTLAYRRKRERNAERQREGYDGVTGKCPTCKRDLRETTCDPEVGRCANTPLV